MLNVCYNIMLEIIAKKKVTCRYLAEKYEVSTRTVLRYLDIIASCGVNFFTVKGRNGGIVLADNFRLSAVFLTEDERARLFEALTVWDKASAGGEALKNKLLALSFDEGGRPIQMFGETLYIEGGLAGDPETEKIKLLPIRSAILNAKVARIEYISRNGESTIRDIEPHAFVLKDMVWYVYAFCRLRGGFRTFKLNRISKLSVTEEGFERKKQEEFTPWQLTDPVEYDTVELLLKVNESARYEVEEWLGVDAVKPAKESGWPYFASGRVFYDNRLVPRLISMGGNVKVVSPSEVKRDIEKAAKSILANI